MYSLVMLNEAPVRHLCDTHTKRVLGSLTNRLVEQVLKAKQTVHLGFGLTAWEDKAGLHTMSFDIHKILESTGIYC